MNEWERLFGLDAQLIFDALVLAFNIFILFMLLSYILFNPVREFLEKRRQKVADDVEAAKKDRQEAKALKAEYEAKLRDANAEASIILGDARRKAMESEENTLRAAREEAGKIVQHGHEQIELEYQKASDEMKKQIVEIASVIAKKAVQDTVDASANDKLIEKALEEMGDDIWQNQ